MYLKSLKTAIIGLTMISLYSCGSKDFTCTLKGTVVDRKSDTIMLKKMTEDERFVKIFIPIINGQFEYKLEVKDVEAWELVFKDEYDNGGWRRIQFFPDQKEVRFELHPTDQPEKNKISGGKYIQAMLGYTKTKNGLFEPQYHPLVKTMDSLQNLKKANSAEMKALTKRITLAKTEAEKSAIMKMVDSLTRKGKTDSLQIAVIRSQIKEIDGNQGSWRYDYIRKNPDINSFSMLVADLQSPNRFVYNDTLKSIFSLFAKKYPDHPYTVLTREILAGMDNIRIGGHFVDFTLPDLFGNKQVLSELIMDKVAVINLWATWCGPCIRHSRELVPIYNEYNKMGFTIVGVASEIHNVQAMKNRLEIEKWPWVNLVELDHQNHIWDKYGASFSVGKIILVDRNGIVLAINPTAEEVRKKLEEIF